MLPPMERKKIPQSKSTVDVPSELISKILLYLEPAQAIQLAPSKRIKECLSGHHTFWNEWCGANGLPVQKCKKLLKWRALLIKAIKTASETLRTFKTHQCDMTQMKLIDKMIFCSSDDQTVKAFGVHGQLLRKFIGHSGGVWSFEATEDLLVTGSTDKTARVWSITNENHVHVLRVHHSTVRTVRCYKDYIVTGSRDSTIAVWKANGVLQHMLLGHLQSVRCLDMDEKYLVSGSYDSTVKLWDYRRGVFLKDVAMHRKRVYVVKIQNGYVASGGLDAEVKIHKIADGTTTSYCNHNSLVLWIDFVGRYIISSSLDGLIVKYDYINRKIVFVIRENSAIKHQKIFNNLLLIGTANEAKIYSLTTGKLIRTLLSAYMIARVDVSDDLIVIGYSSEGEFYVSIFDYSMCKLNMKQG